MPGNPVRPKPERDLSAIPGVLSPEENRQRIKSEDEAMRAFIASMPEGDVLDYLRAPINLFSNSMAGLGAEMIGKGKRFEEKYGWKPKTQAEMNAVNSLLQVMDPAIAAMDYLKIPPVVGPNVPTIAAAMRGVDRAAVNLSGQQAAAAARKGATAAKNAVRDVATSDAAYDIMNRLAEATGTAPKQIMMGKKSRTWNPISEKKAEDLEKQGMSYGDLWRAAGNYRGANHGDWRQEIADYPMAYTPNSARQKQDEFLQKRIKQAEARTTPEEMADFEEWRNKQLENSKSGVIGTVGDFIDHPELKAAYPEMFRRPFKHLSPDHPEWTSSKSSWGYYDPRDRSIAINSTIPEKTQRDVALHELQHAIQHIEGWPQGTSPAAIAAKMAERDQLRLLEKTWQDHIRGLDPSDASLPESQQVLQDIQNDLQKSKQLEALSDPFRAYERTAGEEEARMVERRSRYPEDQLKFYSPYSDFDTDIRQHITEFADGGAVMMAKGGFLGVLERTAKKGLEKAVKAAPQDEALRLAQLRAALPTSQGGLGLPANNTPQQRATAMGRDTAAYHGSKQDITGAFKPGYNDNLAFVTKSSDFANKWIGKGKNQKRLGVEAEKELQQAEELQKKIKYANIDFDALSKLEGDEFHKEYDRMNALAKAAHEKEMGIDANKVHSTVYPVTVESNKIFNPETDMDVMLEFFEKNRIPKNDQDLYASGNYLMYETKPVVEFLKGKGYDSMRLRESTGDDYPTIAVFNPESVRSRFAAHDPFRRDAATAALFGVAAPDLLAKEQEPEKELTIDEFLNRMKAR
jgi:hypothetical protein